MSHSLGQLVTLVDDEGHDVSAIVTEVLRAEGQATGLYGVHWLRTEAILNLDNPPAGVAVTTDVRVTPDAGVTAERVSLQPGLSAGDVTKLINDAVAAALTAQQAAAPASAGAQP